MALFLDAVAVGIVRDCDHHRQLWFEAACHAARCKPARRGNRIKDRVALFWRFAWKINAEDVADRACWWRKIRYERIDEASRWRKAAIEAVEPIEPATPTKPRVMPARLKLVMDVVADVIEQGHTPRGNIACIRAAKLLHLSREQFLAALDEADAWLASETDQAGESFAGPITDAASSGPLGQTRC